eukprot:CAMPEP_0171476848 /NCGR_PEP_ID=MMETSP0946-20130122/3838_1 /TAXON_ID=109269 /ORGANISM="Vaucheria litorea, Strain CCMP2940" /LENGTH=229 /DNA_ID=CAMNT_0012007195 /DNA_START=76 /DNA_END=765 /DNA_ORIENTATION=-
MRFHCLTLLSAIASTSAFAPSSKLNNRSQSLALSANSRSIPFAPVPKNLDGSLPGDVGFDPFGIAGIEFDFSKLIVPNMASMRDSEEKVVVDTLYWMREAELKHGRVAMLAIVGWLAVDFGLRFPGTKYLGLNPVTAHDAMVAGGNMVVMLHFALLLELINGAAIFAAAKGSGRKAGDFSVDPLGLSKDNAKKARYELSEVKNGRLAMLAISGIITQAVITGHGFPYLF